MLSASGIKFTRTPAFIGQGKGYQYISGFRSFSKNAILGKIPTALWDPNGDKSWYASTDSGITWKNVFLNSSYPIEGSIAAAPIADYVAHNYGSIPDVPDRTKEYTAFTSTWGTFFKFDIEKRKFNVIRKELKNKIVFTGIPKPGVTCGDMRFWGSCPFLVSGAGSSGGIIEIIENNTAVLVQTVTVYLGDKRYSNPRKELYNISLSIIAFRSTDGGFTWTYSSVVISASAVPESEEGPNENDLALIDGGKTILCVARVDGGDGILTHRYAPYVATFSHDGGRSWLKPVQLAGIGSVRPRLLSFGSTIILSGGRLSPENRDIYLWVNANGDGIDWTEIESVSYWHNKLRKKSMHKFPPSINHSSIAPSEVGCTSYTSLLRTDEKAGFVTYAIISNEIGTAYALSFEV
jgi:hypothetical protein